MKEKEMIDKIMSVVNGNNPAEILTALTYATAVVVKASIDKDRVVEFAEKFKIGIIEAVRRTNVTIAVVKMNDNG